MGCGLVALGVHLRNLRRHSRLRLVALADRDHLRRERAHGMAPSARVFDDPYGLLQLPDVDAVIVGVPYEEHATAAIAALSSGKHVYLEKPFATDPDEAGRILAESLRSDRVLMVGFNYRFHPFHRQMRDAIRSGAIGEVLDLRSAFHFSRQVGVDWQLTRHGSFGALFDIAPHHIDLTRFLLDAEVSEVAAKARSLNSHQDNIHLQLVMSTGVLVHCSFALQTAATATVVVSGSNGRLAVDLYRSHGVEFSPGFPSGQGGWLGRHAARRSLPVRGLHLIEKLRSPWQEPSFLGCLNHFAAAVEAGEVSSPDAWDGYCNQQVIAAALESLRSGASVAVPPAIRPAASTTDGPR
ncbi:Gfo/Idh/MocA family oxidoreductase [Synechococcus sp. Cruz-7B9]|nr:Gfo/Idh/MocA family oxidoreductase [Synechococcus sp. Cruz-7B9]